MRINMFKAARRAALALCVAWVGGCVAFGFFAKPRVHLTYAIDTPEAAPVRVNRCGPDDGSRFILAQDVEGGDVDVTLCFKTLKAQSRRWWMEASYSLDVVRQMDAFEKSFRLPPQGVAEAERLRQQRQLDEWKHAATSAAFGLAAIGLLAVVAGWLARGVLGIPRGQDDWRVTLPGTAKRRPRSRRATAESSGRVKRRTQRLD